MQVREIMSKDVTCCTKDTSLTEVARMMKDCNCGEIPVAEGNNSNSSIGLCPLCRYIPIKAGDEAIDRPDRVAEAIVFAANSGVDVMDVTDPFSGLTFQVALYPGVRCVIYEVSLAWGVKAVKSDFIATLMG